MTASDVGLLVTSLVLGPPAIYCYYRMWRALSGRDAKDAP